MVEVRPGRLDRLAAVGITRSVLGLCLLWLVAFGPIVQPMFHAGAPRMALTGALVDDGTVRIDGYLVGIDRTERDGHVYSDKAVGQQAVAVPMHLLSRLVGAEAPSVARVDGNLTLWWVTLWSAGVPFVALVLLAAVATTRAGRPIPTPALGVLCFGTMLLPFSVTLYGHVLGAALGFGAWLVLDGDDAPGRRALLSGGLVGAAVLVEYQLFIVAVVLAGVLVGARRWGDLVRYALAGVPFAAVMAAYQWAAYGSPLSTGYGSKDKHDGATFLVTGVPSPTTAWSFLVGSRGILVFTPIVAVGLWGLVARRRRLHDRTAAVALAVCLGFVLLQAGWPNPWGGETPGPRYLIPMLPFLAYGVAEVWSVLAPALRRAVAVVSLATMVLCTVTEHLMAHGTIVGIDHLGRLLDGGPEPTLLTLALGPLGWLPHLLAVGALLWWWRSRTAGDTVRGMPAAS